MQVFIHVSEDMAFQSLTSLTGHSEDHTSSARTTQVWPLNAKHHVYCPQCYSHLEGETLVINNLMKRITELEKDIDSLKEEVKALDVRDHALFHKFHHIDGHYFNLKSIVTGVYL